MSNHPFREGEALVRAGAQGSDALFTLDREDLIRRFRSYGALLFEGFGVDLGTFERFTDLFGTSAGDHPALEDGTRDVFLGRSMLNAHAELSYTPWPPELIWFYCKQPASTGGATTMYDGVRFLREMGEPLETIFRTRKLKFSQFFSPKGWWKWFHRSREELEAMFDRWGVRYRFEKSNCLFTEYSASAIRRTKFSNEDGFVNPVLHALDDPRFYGMTFEDGSPIGVDIATALRGIAREIVVPLRWSAPGDFVLLDNTRWMHGRESYEDPKRRIKARHAMPTFG